MAYYYLVASLVPLTLDSDVFHTPEDFFESCKHLLSHHDREDLERVVNGKPETAHHPFVQQWLRRENQLKNALVFARTARLSISPKQFLREPEEIHRSCASVAAEILSKQNPLEKERTLDAYRWQFLDELAANDYFGMSSVFSFILKLKLVIRWKSLNEEKGRDVVKKLLDGTCGKIRYGM